MLARVFMHRAGGVPIAFNCLWVLRGDAARDGLQGARGGGGQCQIVVQAGAMSELGVYVALRADQFVGISQNVLDPPGQGGH